MNNNNKKIIYGKKVSYTYSIKRKEGNKGEIINRVTIRAILWEVSLPGFLFCLKYPGFGCLHCAGRLLCDIHECYREQRLLLLNHSHAYLGVIFVWCAYLHCFDYSL